MIIRRLIVPLTVAVVTIHAGQAFAQGAFPAPLPGQTPVKNDPAFPPVNGAAPVASIGAALGVAVAGWFIYLRDGLLQPAVLTVLAAVLIWRHRANLQRLAAGTENRFQFRRKKSADGAAS